MRSEWEYVKLEDAVERGSSNISLNKVKDDTGEYSLYGAKGLMKTISFYDQDKPYLAIIKDGAGVGRVSSHPGKSSVLATMQYLIPKDGYNIDFVEYFLNSISFDDFKTGSTIPHIYFKDYKCVKIPKLSEAEQKEIVRILDLAFERIDAALTSVRQNIVNADELFQSKLTQTFSNPDPSWQTSRLAEVASFEYGHTSKSVESGDFRYVRITDIGDDGLLRESGKKYILNDNKTGKYILDNGMLLMARTGASFAEVLYYEDVEPSVFASYLIKINFKIPIDNKLYWYFSKSKEYWGQANSLASGSAQPHFNGKALGEVVFSYPVDKVEQEVLIKSFETLNRQTKALRRKYQLEELKLLELKKSVLQKAFTGNLTNNVI